MRRSNLSAVLAILAGLSGASTAGAQGDPIAPLEEQIELSKGRLNQIREEQRRLRNEMASLSAQIHDARDELDNLNQQTQNQEALLREMDHQLAIRDQQVMATTGDLLRTQDQLVEKQVLFARRARDLYKRGPLANVHVLLTAQSFSDLLNRYQYLYLVALHDRLIVRQIEELKGLLEVQYSKLRQELQGLRDVRAEKVREIQHLYDVERQRGQRLAAVRGLQVTTERRLQQLSRDETELTNLVQRLEREREAAEALAATGPTRGTLTTSERGALSWPVEGQIVYGFGQQRNADGAVIIRGGIGIAAPENTPVKAVQSGTVVVAEPLMSYGPSVIVSHGGGYYSLYLYLSSTAVAEGDAVREGQIIGYVGGAATPEGAHIEFQIRRNQETIDPLSWLRRTRD
ncbi:MAG: peptidoglycan DD-metalloendopeptidase family protein [Gemmatimonadota bacterium]|nr:MAG: peptidoglycan DD-metalloendopeptidase family protein [Gemmatimonadota bacterium]